MIKAEFQKYGSYTTDSLYQWDLNQELQFVNTDISVAPVIHFCNRKSKESLLVQSTLTEGIITCPVPNVLLQEPFDIVAYIVSMEAQKATTLFKMLIPVNRRLKPSDYEYTDNIPILTYEAIKADIQHFFNLSKAEIAVERERINKIIVPETTFKNIAICKFESKINDGSYIDETSRRVFGMSWVEQVNPIYNPNSYIFKNPFLLYAFGRGYDPNTGSWDDYVQITGDVRLKSNRLEVSVNFIDSDKIYTKAEMYAVVAYDNTVDNTELEDIRVGTDGKIHDSAGDAVRSQIGKLKEDKVDKPSISDDGKIPKAKEGGVEWVEVGQPTDDQTDSAVTKWLDKHPEATTTVQDGVIGEKKIEASFLPWIKKDYVTPEMFGAQGDGIKDDSDAFQKCINSGKPIHLLSNKVYLIKKTIEIIDRVNFAIEGNYSKINFTCDYLFEICNSNNFMINNVLLLCNGNNGFKFTIRTGTDRCGKTLFKNISFFGCLTGFKIDSPCGYNYFENVYFHKTLDNSVGFVIGEKIDKSFTVYPNYIYIDKVTFDGESAGSNKTGIKLFYSTYIYISECDFCNIIDGCAIEICNNKYMHTISIQKNAFFNNVCSLLLKNEQGLDGIMINNNNFYLRNSNIILNRSSNAYVIGSLSFSENTIVGTSSATKWFIMNKITHFVCLGNNFESNLTPVYKHCDIVCLRENMISDNPVHRFLDFTDNTPKTINCGGKYYMTEFRWGVFSDKKFSLSTTYDDDGDMIATITPVDNSGFMRCFLVPTMN